VRPCGSAKRASQHSPSRVDETKHLGREPCDVGRAGVVPASIEATVIGPVSTDGAQVSGPLGGAFDQR